MAGRGLLPALSPPVEAALLMLLANFCVAGMTASIRVASHELHPFEIAFFRNLFGFVFVLPFLWRAGPGMLRAHAPGRLLISSGGHLVAMLGYFLAVAYMPLAELTALAFTKPLFATLGAALVLHEVVRGRRWSAIGIGFLGVMIVLRPGAEAFSPYAGFVLLSAVASAAVVLMVKQMTLRDGSTTIVLYQTLFLTVLSLPPALWFWRMPESREPGAGRADRGARHDRVAVLHARLRARRRFGGDALRVPQAADHRGARLSDVRRGAERVDLARRGGDLRRQHLHRAPRGPGRAGSRAVAAPPLRPGA